jgi:hypothetical protein
MACYQKCDFWPVNKNKEYRAMVFNNKQMHDIAEWCEERGILSDRIDHATIKSACKSLSISEDGNFDNYQLKEIGNLYNS